MIDRHVKLSNEILKPSINAFRFSLFTQTGRTHNTPTPYHRYNTVRTGPFWTAYHTKRREFFPLIERASIHRCVRVDLAAVLELNLFTLKQ
jgi:hypothetical protein